MPRGRPRKVVSSTTENKDLFDAMVVDDSSIEQGEEVPFMSDPKWNEYVLFQLQDDEQDDRNPGVVYPKTDGLGRLVRLLIGDIILSESDVVVATPDYSVVKHRIVVKSVIDNEELIYTAIADASVANTDPPYSKFLPQVASTRARGRVYKDVLGLKNVTTADEISEVAESDLLITSSQQFGVKKICKELKIDVIKFLNMNGDHYDKLEEVSKNDASRMMYQLNKYKRGEEDIREDILIA